MHSVSVMELKKQQYTSCMKVGTGRNLDLSREYHKKLFGPLFHSWWNCPLKRKGCHMPNTPLLFRVYNVFLKINYSALVSCNYSNKNECKRFFVQFLLKSDTMTFFLNSMQFKK